MDPKRPRMGTLRRQETIKHMPNENLENLHWLPVLENSVWGSLQLKNYDEAESALGGILESIPPSEWGKTFWVAIIKGFPIVRGELTEDEWREKVQPLLARLILQIASGEAAANLFRELAAYPDVAGDFENLLILIASTTDIENDNKIKIINRPLYTFLIASPAQEYFSNITPYHIRKIPEAALAQRYTALPQKLQDEIFSYATAEDVMRIAGEQHLSPEKTNAIAVLTGRVLLGFLHFEDIKMEIQKTLDLDSRIADAVFQALDKKIFSEFKEEIHDAYDPMTGQTNQPEISGDTENKPQEKTITFAGLDTDVFEPEESVPVHTSDAPVTEKREDNPFVLQEEKPTETAGTMTGKKFSLSLGGFFKPKKKETPAQQEPVRAKIDLFGGGKDEKKVIHYSELRTPLEAREEDIFKSKEETGSIGPVEQIEPVIPVDRVEPIGAIDSTETTPAPASIEDVPSSSTQSESSAPAPLTPAPAKKSPWTFKWFGSQAPARDEQKPVPESIVVNDTSLEEKTAEGAKETKLIEPTAQIAPINPVEQTEQNDEPKTPTIEGNIVDLSTLKK